MIATMKELYEELEKDTISKDALEIFKELDGTPSITTQASLNNMLLDLYKRVSKEDITIETIGERVTKDEFTRWVNENLDEYSRNTFMEAIKGL